MRGFTFRSVGLAAIAGLLMASLSCGHDQKLVSITVLPQGASITGNPTVQFTALGHYIHPPVTKDITTQVIWKSDSPTIITFNFNPGDPPGLATPTGLGCGTNLGISAKVYSNPSNPTHGTVVVGLATINVSEPQLGLPCG